MKQLAMNFLRLFPVKVIKRGGVLLSLILLVSACLQYNVQTAYAQSGEGRHVYVVFDDSGSMRYENGAWCEAQYALECFTAMLGENDTLYIYPMSAYTGETPSQRRTVIEGSEDNSFAVQTIHNGEFLEDGYDDGILWNADTVFSAAEAAYKDLQADPVTDTRLIILTDGDFCECSGVTCYGGAPEKLPESYIKKGYSYASAQDIAKRIEQMLLEWSHNGTQIQYLALGANINRNYLPTEATGLEVNTCSSNSEILNTVIDSCNWAFTRSSLEHDGTILSTNLPLKKVIVFAQGDSAEVAGLICDGETIKASQTCQVRYPMLPTSTEYPGAPLPNTSLCGVVAVFDVNIPKDAKLELSTNVDTFDIYYEPNVDIGITLTDADGWVYDSIENGTELKSGTYTAQYSLLDPDTGQLLDLGSWEPAYDVKLLSDAGEVAISEGQSFQIPEGPSYLSIGAKLVDSQSGAETNVAQEERAISATPKTFIDWLWHFWWILPLLLLLLLIALAALIVRKHMMAPRLSEELYPELYNGDTGEKPSSLKVEAYDKVTPFFGAETQEFGLHVKSPYRSMVVPASIKLRATDKNGNMVVDADSWDELVTMAKHASEDGANDCVKIGSKKVADCKFEDEPLPLTSASKIKFAGTRDGEEVTIELRLKGKKTRESRRSRDIESY